MRDSLFFCICTVLGVLLYIMRCPAYIAARSLSRTIIEVFGFTFYSS